MKKINNNFIMLSILKRYQDRRDDSATYLLHKHHDLHLDPNTHAKSQVQQYTHVILDLGRQRQADEEIGAYCPAREPSQMSGLQGQEELNMKT